jgi:uncharacterized membrane protein
MNNFMAVKENKFSRRVVALFWLLAVAFVIGVLLYLEQIAMLYVIATLSLVVLLIVVGFSDLEKVGRESADDFASDSR